MLNKNPKKRYNIKECLDHKWFDKARSNKNELDSKFLDNLSNIKRNCQLKTAALNLYVKYISNSQIKKIREQFEAIDTDNSGYIDAVELARAFRTYNPDLPQEKIDSLIEKIDVARDQKIAYSEFLMSTVSTRKQLNDNRIMMLFKEFDFDGDAYISRDELKEMLDNMNQPCSEKDIDEIMKEHDTSKDGRISYDEFCTMLIYDDAHELTS